MRVSANIAGDTPATTSKENRNDQDGHDVDNLDHGIDRRPGRVLVRIAHRITGHSG
ncbi:MAG: hypothetical protein QOE73_2525, partial [Verrucomicrobiota bacterium]